MVFSVGPPSSPSPTPVDDEEEGVATSNRILKLGSVCEGSTEGEEATVAMTEEQRTVIKRVVVTDPHVRGGHRWYPNARDSNFMTEEEEEED